MKKLLSGLLLLTLLLSLTACGGEVIEFVGEDNEEYYYEYSDGIKSVTNYHPYKFWALPDYQELVQYGDGAGLENEGTVYFIYVVDTSRDSQSAEAYYTAELDGATEELLFEDGAYFSDDSAKTATVERLLDIIKNTDLK